jgi:uncharacterized protein YkwD
MIDNDYFSHSIPGVGNVFDVLDQRGYCYEVAGENIGWNTYPVRPRPPPAGIHHPVGPGIPRIPRAAFHRLLRSTP